MAAPSKSTSIVPGSSTDQFSTEQISQLASRSKQKDFEMQVINWTKSAHLRCRTVRMQIERQWYLNLAFYSGKQNVQLVPTSNSSGSSVGVRLYVPPAPYYRSRPVINRIRPIIRTELSKLTAQKPSATVVPSTMDTNDTFAAQAAEQIWESVYHEKRIHSVFRQTMLWTLSCGTGFMKVYWDPSKKSSQWTPPNPDEMKLLMMQGMKEKPADGDFCYENVTPFHIFVPDLMQEDIENQPYVIQLQTRTPEWVKMNYGLVMPPNVMEASDILNDSFLSLVGANQFRKDTVLCYEVWVKPGNVEFMPNGGMFTIVGNRLVQFSGNGNPYQHGQYPYARIPHIPSGRFYADSVITDLIPLQREYNRTRGQMVEAKNRMAHPQLISAKGSIVASKVTTEPGQVIEYNLGYPKPEPLPMQNMPAYVSQEVDRQLGDMEDISGQHDVSKGQVPAGVTAATAINYLQEQDESMLSVTHDGIEEAFEKIGYQTLNHVQQYWDLPRKVKVVGKDGFYNVISFQGSDLKGNTDIRVESGSSLPTSKAAKQAFLMDMMSNGFIPPEKGLELMEMGGVQRLYEEIQVDAAQASRENMRMASVTQDQMSQYAMTFVGPPDPMTGQPSGLVDPNTGQPLVDQAGNPTQPPLIVPVNSFDSHQTHIMIHNTFRKSQEFEQLDPNIKQLFEEHVNQHMMAMGVIPGQPAPQQGQNAVTSGGMDQGQADPTIQQVANAPQDSNADPMQMDPNSAPPTGGEQPSA